MQDIKNSKQIAGTDFIIAMTVRNLAIDVNICPEILAIFEKMGSKCSDLSENQLWAFVGMYGQKN